MHACLRSCTKIFRHRIFICGTYTDFSWLVNKQLSDLILLNWIEQFLFNTYSYSAYYVYYVPDFILMYTTTWKGKLVIATLQMGKLRCGEVTQPILASGQHVCFHCAIGFANKQCQVFTDRTVLGGNNNIYSSELRERVKIFSVEETVYTMWEQQKCVISGNQPDFNGRYLLENQITFEGKCITNNTLSFFKQLSSLII